MLGTSLTLTLALSLAQADPLRPRMLAAEEAREDLELLRRALDVVHPGLERYTPRDELEVVWDELDAALANGIDDLAFYRELALATARVRCGHTRVEGPPWLDEARAETPTHLPFHFRLFDGRMIVHLAPEGSPLRRGMEVLAIEDQPVAELVERLAATVPIDGWTDAIRPSRLQAAYEYRDSGFDHFLPAFLGFRERFRLRLRDPETGRVDVVGVPALTSEAWAALDPDAGWRDFADGIELERLDERTAWMRVITFVNYRRPVDPVERFTQVFRSLHEDGIEHLVLDLRSCGGGSADVAWTLASFLIDEPFVLDGMSTVRSIRFGDLVEHLSTWVENAFELPEEMFRALPEGGYELLEPGPATLAPHPDRFRGRVTILIGPYNASGTTMLLAQLRERTDHELVGEPTGGSAEGATAGVLFTLTLPHSGIRVNVPAIFGRTGVREFRPGYGVDPDRLVPFTLDDYLAERDPVLEAAWRGIDPGR